MWLSQELFGAPGQLLVTRCTSIWHLSSSFCALAFAYHFVTTASGIERETTVIFFGFSSGEGSFKVCSEYEMTKRLLHVGYKLVCM